MYRCGYISVVGRPNAGKSSFINAIVGQKVAIVSPKAQTTRNNILGIYNDGENQFIFVDTPGIHKAKNNLDKFMMKNVRSSLEDVDLILYAIDGTKKFEDDEIDYIKSISKKGSVVILVTKIDIANKKYLFEELIKLNNIDVEDIVCIDSKTKKGFEEVIKVIKKYIPEDEEKNFVYEEDEYTDKSIRFIVGEIIREKTLLFLDKEIPHGIAIDVRSYKECEKYTEIFADIYCARANHKEIIIGKGGQTLRKIGENARKDIESLIDGKVVLKLWVRDKKDWQNNQNFLNDIGLN